MGVPRFFSWVNNNYQVIIDPTINPDEFYFDLNCLLHPKCFEVANEEYAKNPDIDDEKLEAKMFNRVIEYIVEILEYIKPKSLVYIAIDGVAPMAKMKHQRLRRYKSIKEADIRNSIISSFGKEIPKKWNNTVITPGTNFMKKLSIQLLKFMKGYKPEYTKNLKFILSTSNTHGEGEHKIHQYLKERSKEEGINEKIKVIYGLDADLLFLTMATGLDKLYVFREAQFIDEKSQKKFLMVDMDLLKLGIYEDIQSKCEKVLDKNKIINDYTILGFLLGNDFLPNVPSLTLSPIHPKLENGLDMLLSIYPEYIEKNEYLCESKNYMNLFEMLANIEQEYFKKLYTRGRIYMRSNESDPCKLALFEFDNLLKSDINFLDIGKDEPIKYKRRYYNHFFNIKYPVVSEKYKESVNKICKDYLIGLSWVNKYYFDKCPDWLWIYEHHQVPFMSDLYEYLKSNDKMPEIVELDNKSTIKPLEQLMMVIPPEMKEILPKECQNIFKNERIKWMYPTYEEYDFDIFMKNKFWLCYPEIPNPDYNKFKVEMNKIKLSDESIKINKTFIPLEYVTES